MLFEEMLFEENAEAPESQAHPSPIGARAGGRGGPPSARLWREYPAGERIGAGPA
jgi:hypothetical protein